MIAEALAPSAPRLPPELAEDVRRLACEETRPLILAGLALTADYQDTDYAALYWRRLLPFVNLASNGGRDECDLLAAATRQLALGMTYPDLIRTAELKLRTRRLKRIRAKLGADEGEMSRAGEFTDPRVEEIADTMPFGRRLSSSAIGKSLFQKFAGRRRAVRGTSWRGCFLLYLLASLKPWRRGSLRFARETELLEEWLDTVWAAAKRDLKLATSLAQARSLLRGYGDVYTRGVQKFDMICEYIRNNKFSVPAANVIALMEAAQAADGTEPLERAIASFRTGARPATRRAAKARLRA